MNQHVFNQQVAALRRCLYALQQHTNTAPEAQQTLLVQVLEELALAPEELQVAEEELQQHNEELIAAQRAVEAERQRYESACAKLLRWQNYWTKEERPLVRELLALVGKALLEREDLAGAEHYLMRALHLSLSWDVARTLARVEERKGEQAQRAGELSQALTSYQQAVAYDPCNRTYAQKLAQVRALCVAERRRKHWEAGRGVARRVSLGGALVLLMVGGIGDARKAREGFQTSSVSQQAPLSPSSVETVDSAEATGEPAEAVEVSVEEKSQSPGEELERTAKGTELPTFDEGRAKLKEVKTVVTDQENRKGEKTWRIRVRDVNRPPPIVVASPPADSLEMAAGDVQKFSVKASDPDKDDRLGYAWFLDGHEVGRGPRWEFRAPSPPTSKTRYRVEVKVSDKSGLKDRLAWNIALKIPSPPPRIIGAQPQEETVLTRVGQPLDFAVAAALAGGAGEAKQGLRYPWSVDDAPLQTTQTDSFRFVATPPATSQLTAIAVSPEGLKSAPRRWTVEVRPPVVPPPSLSLSEGAVRAWLEAQRQAWEEKNVDGLVELGVVSGRNAARVRKILSEYKSFSVALQNVAIRLEGNRAAVTFSRIDTIDGRPVPHPDRKVFRLEKEATGRLTARLQ